MNVNLRGLREQLRNFDEDGHYVSGTNWSVSRGGYDLNWELSYNNIPVIDCVANTLINIGMDKKIFEKVCEIIIEEYDTNPYYPMQICRY